MTSPNADKLLFIDKVSLKAYPVVLEIPTHSEPAKSTKTKTPSQFLPLFLS